MRSRREILMVGREAGSVLLWMLFVCLGLAILVQVMTVVVTCAERARSDEASGRAQLEAQAAELGSLRLLALREWAATDWLAAQDDGPCVEGRLSTIEGSLWALQALARTDPDVSRTVVSALVERGRDGLDLPLAALVAHSVEFAAARTAPCLIADTDTTEVAIAHLRLVPSGLDLGETCAVEQSRTDWRLDPGWLEFVLRASGSHDDVGLEQAMDAVAHEGAMAAANGPNGCRIELAQVLEAGEVSSTNGMSSESPVLVTVTGGATLDARDAGDLFGVIVVDNGSVLLNGTRLHGAVFATGAVNVGLSGQVLFSATVLRWATDRSIRRVRLVPGTRQEATE